MPSPWRRDRRPGFEVRAAISEEERQQIRELYKQGLTINAIAQVVGRHRQTVRKYLTDGVGHA